MKIPRIETLEKAGTRRRPSVDYIVAVVSGITGVPEQEIRGKNRKRERVEARQIACHLAVFYFGYTTVWVGQQIGGRDHSTVIHSRDAIAGKCDTEPNLYALYVEAHRRCLAYIPRDAAVKTGSEPMIPLSLLPVFVAATLHQLMLQLLLQ